MKRRISAWVHTQITAWIQRYYLGRCLKGTWPWSLHVVYDSEHPLHLTTWEDVETLPLNTLGEWSQKNRG